jgi:ADP-dependent NAD(P)H-hydrate dehydratase
VDDARPLDLGWLRKHPLPQPDGETDKNARGRVIVAGGSTTVPGGVRLTAEAALRAGAGKVRIGTVEPAALPLGVLLPEAAVVALPADAEGEIDASEGLSQLDVTRCDALVLGPAMSSAERAGQLVGAVLAQDMSGAGLVIDAAALFPLASHAERLKRLARPPLLTPHAGEMAGMLEWDADRIARDPPAAAREAARRFGAVVVLKGSLSFIAAPDEALFCYAGGNVGMATGGSGDVLAGIAGALLARGCEPLQAALWSVWLHGEAGRRCVETIGPLGFLARDMLGFIPAVMRSAE